MALSSGLGVEISEQPRPHSHLLLPNPSPFFQTLGTGPGAERCLGALPAALCPGQQQREGCRQTGMRTQC